MFCPIPGIGELRLLLPFLRQLLQEQEGWILWVDPPYSPYGPALQAHGVDLQRMLIVDGCQQDEKLWTIKQGLKSETCLAVIAWPGTYSFSQLRQLQLYACSGKTSCFIFQKVVNHNASSAAVKIQLSPGRHSREIQIQLLKCRGRWPMQNQCSIQLPTAAFTNDEENSCVVDLSTFSKSGA